MSQENLLTAQIVVGVLQVIAIIISAVTAVFIDRYLQQRREERQSRLQILKTLMATRGGVNLSPDHINALNLIDFEFYHSPKIRQAWKNFLSHHENRSMANTDWLIKRQDLIIDLIVTVAADLGYHYKHVDLKSESYLPEAWLKVEQEQKEIREKLLSWLKRERALPLEVKLLNEGEMEQFPSIDPLPSSHSKIPSQV